MGMELARFVATLEAPVMAIYGREFDVALKSDQSPVTEADWWVHRQIMQFLAEMTPDIPVLSEESADIPWSTRSGWRRFWLVDPIDGTREFVNKTGEFTINVALIDEGRPVLGVVGVPAQGQIYLGCPAKGAYRFATSELLSSLSECFNTQSIGAVESAAVPRVVASRSHLDPQTRQYIEALGAHELVQAGSSLKFCRIAEGLADLYPRFGPTSEWDTAAAQAVLEAAGGAVTDMQGAPLRYGKPSYLNPHFIARGKSWQNAQPLGAV